MNKKSERKSVDPLAYDQPLELDVTGHGVEALLQPLSQLVAANPDGVGVPELADAVKTSPPTVRRALERLERERLVYSRTVGRVTIWYPNGRLIHPYLQLRKESRGRIYQFMAREGKAGPMVQIVEKSFSVLSGEKAEGSVYVELAALDEFIDALHELRNRFANYQKTQVR